MRAAIRDPTPYVRYNIAVSHNPDPNMVPAVDAPSANGHLRPAWQPRMHPPAMPPVLASAEASGYTTPNSGDRRMTTEDTLVTSRDGRVGRILLNRPRALNALDLVDDPRLRGDSGDLA